VRPSDQDLRPKAIFDTVGQIEERRMRVTGGLRVGAVVAALMVMVSSCSVLAGDACPAGTLGVSRVLEVDTTGGPWYGAPNGDPNFLAPGEVVLTFDDGPSPNDTREILAALAKECTKATFFVVGEMVAEHPEIVKEVAEQGHTIGTHTWSHPNLAKLLLPDVTREIEATFDAAQKASPEPVAPFFRYPYLSTSKVTVDYLKSRNIGQFAVDIDSSDWRVRSSKGVITRVMAGLKKRGRGIILMHDIHMWTADALPELLAEIRAGGYKVVQLKPKMAVQLIADVSPPATRPNFESGVRKFKRQWMATHARKPAAGSKLHG
jgi:peptidoglycan-N-acetylglucosamine deacetylase